jgi:uncharacterized lipoprotein YddW (UPF0748 family)
MRAMLSFCLKLHLTMNRRTFLGAIAALGLARQQTPESKRKNWVWMRPNLDRTADDWKREFATMRGAGIHAINAEVWNGRQALFRSRRLPVRANWLETTLPLAKAAGLELHAWMWTCPCLVPEILQTHPDWYNVNAKGESAVDKPAYVDYYKFLDPAQPAVREFIRGTVAELAAIDGLTGIHLDYVRHPDAILPSGLWSKYGIVQDRVYPPYDYGYTDYSRRQFRERHGVDPMSLADPETNTAWLQYRLDSVVDLVNDYLAPAARAGGKRITAAVFPGPSLARVMVRQDWGRFNLDAVLPMLYHRFYETGPEWVRQYTREAVKTVRFPVYSGLYVPPLEPPELAQTIAMAFEGGASGVSIFDAGAMNADRWKTFAAAVASR